MMDKVSNFLVKVETTLDSLHLLCLFNKGAVFILLGKLSTFTLVALTSAKFLYLGKVPVSNWVKQRHFPLSALLCDINRNLPFTIAFKNVISKLLAN